MTTAIFVIALMLPGFAACAGHTAQRESTTTTTSTYASPYPEVVAEKKTTTTVTVQPSK